MADLVRKMFEILFFFFQVKVNKDANPLLFQKTDETFDLSGSTICSSTDPKIQLFDLGRLESISIRYVLGCCSLKAASKY